MEEINLDNNTTLCQKRMYYNSDGPCLLVRVGLRVTLGKKNKHQNVSTSLVTSLMPNLQTSKDKCHTEIVHPNSIVFLEQLFSLLRHCLLILLVCSNNNNNHLRGRRRHYLLSNHFTIVTWYCTKKITALTTLLTPLWHATKWVRRRSSPHTHINETMWRLTRAKMSPVTG